MIAAFGIEALVDQTHSISYGVVCGGLRLTRHDLVALTCATLCHARHVASVCLQLEH